MKNQKGISPIIAVIILVIILVVGSAYYFKQQTKPVSKSSVVDETANWKTYTATNLYQISYPLDKYSIKSGTDLKAEWPGQVIINPNDSFLQGTQITIVIDGNPNNLSLSNSKDLFIKNDRSMCSTEASNGKNIKEISLGNEKAFEMDSCTGGLTGTEKQIVTIKNNKVFNIIVEYRKSGIPAMQVADQILSTFKFTD